MAEKKKVEPMKPFKAWVVVDRITGRFVHEGGIGLSRADSAPMEGERLVRVLVTEVTRGK
jgi:hypothetical protein